MQIKYPALIFGILSISLLACKKESKPADTNTDPQNSVFTVGDTMNMIIANRNIEVLSEAKYNLENDFEDDFMFETSSWQSPGSGIHYFVKIIPLVDMELFSYITRDSLFQEIEWEREPLPNGGYGDTVGIRYRYSCLPEPGYSLYEISGDTTKVLPVDSGAFNDQTGYFQAGSNTLVFADGWRIIKNPVDTTLDYEIIHLADNCRDFPQDEDKYIVFRKMVNSETKLGWIKLNIHQAEVQIVETAVQD